MLKKYRQLLIGIVIGFVLASSVAFGADVIRNAYFNKELKLAINGHEIEDIRIVTVELEGEQYGRNYYSIADLIKAINDYGGISAKVDFDSNTKTTIVEIERKEDVAVVTPTPTPTPVPESPKELRERLMSIIEKGRQDEIEEEEPPKRSDGPVVNRYTEDGLEILEVDGEKYIDRLNIHEKYRKYVSLEFNARLKTLKLSNDSPPGFLNLTPETLVYFEEEIPWYNPLNNGMIYIKYDYYINVLVPKLEMLIKK